MTYEQSAVIPYRIRKCRIEVLAVTNQSGSRWIIPKGLVEDDLSPAESAAREAYEEAGIMGEVSARPVGHYAYRKWDGVCEVAVFLLAVDTLYDTWPESEWRKRRWLSAKQAIATIDDRIPRDLLKTALDQVNTESGSGELRPPVG